MSNPPQQNQATQGGNIFSQYDYKKSSSPGLMLTDLILKGIPIAFYIIGSFVSIFIVNLAVITIMSAVDFWFTKNVLGRVMVGLRWGRVIHADGEEELIFECKKDEATINAADKRMFWGFLTIATVFWLAMLLWNIFTFTSLVLIIVPLALQATNLYCFYKCSAEQQTQMKGFISAQQGNLTRQAVDHFVIQK